MNDRERLVEIFQQLTADGRCIPMDEVIDYLKDHGVTVQKHGRWVSLTDCSNAGVYCSECHKKVYKEDYARANRKNKLRSPYCPNCGAKMDEEGEANG